MPDRQTKPNYELIAYLEEARADELRDEGGVPSGTITVSLNLDHRHVAVREEWLDELDDEQRIWLTAFAGVCAVLRYAARFPASEFSSEVRRIAQARNARISEWNYFDTVDHEDVWFEVELLGAPGETSPGGYLLMDVPHGLSELAVPEPIAILRKYLLNHFDPDVERACALAFETLASFAGRGELRAEDLGDQITLQLDAPMKIMRVLEAAELIAPFLSATKPDGSGGC